MPSDDTVAAKFRMRRLRAQQGGSTVYDRARIYAIRKTLEQHKGTFHLYRLQYLNSHLATRGEIPTSAKDPNRETFPLGRRKAD